MSLLATFRKNDVKGLVSDQLESLLAEVSETKRENTLLKAIILRMESQVSVINSKLDDIADHVVKTSVGVTEVKTTEFVGKKLKFADGRLDEYKKKDEEALRLVIKAAAKVYHKKHGGRPNSGFVHIYMKLREVTGVDVLTIGQKAITAIDKNGKKAPRGKSYINTCILEGVLAECALVASDVFNSLK